MPLVPLSESLGSGYDSPFFMHPPALAVSSLVTYATIFTGLTILTVTVLTPPQLVQNFRFLSPIMQTAADSPS